MSAAVAQAIDGRRMGEHLVDDIVIFLDVVEGREHQERISVVLVQEVVRHFCACDASLVCECQHRHLGCWFVIDVVTHGVDEMRDHAEARTKTIELHSGIDRRICFRENSCPNIWLCQFLFQIRK